LIRSTLNYLPSRVVPAAAGAIAIPLVATQLEPSEFGTFALVAAALPFIAVVSADWVVAGHQRYAHADRSPQATIWVALLGTGTALMLVGVWLVTGELAVLAVALLLPAFLLLRLQSIDLQMTGRSRRYSVHTCTYSLTRAALLVLAAHVTGDLEWVFAAWVAASVLTLLVGPRLKPRGRPSLERLTALGRIGMPLIAAGIALNASATADRFIIAAMEGRTQTGIYSFGYMVGETLVALPLTLPFLAAQYMGTKRWDSGDSEGTLAFFRKVLLVQTAFGSLAVLILSATAEEIFRTVGPQQYAGSAGVLITVGSAQLLAGVAPYLLVVAALREQTRRVILPSAVTAFTSVVLTSAGVAVAGIEGAAVATVATYGVMLVALQRALQTPLLDRSSIGIVSIVAAAATCSALLTDDLRFPLLTVMLAASIVQCIRAARAIRGA